MKLYLISNNLLLDHLDFTDLDLDVVRVIRPLSIDGENNALNISNTKELQNIHKIYTSIYSSAISTSKYLSQKLQIPLILTEELNDCKVGHLGSKNMKMVKGLQDHEFTYKLSGGESLVDVGNRLNDFIKKIKDDNICLFTHKRAILGYLLKFAKVGYNLDENLILEFNDKIIYDDTDTYYDIYEITYDNNEVINIEKISK